MFSRRCVHVHFTKVCMCAGVCFVGVCIGCMCISEVYMCVCVFAFQRCAYVCLCAFRRCVHVCAFHRCMHVCTCAFQRCVHVHTQSSLVEGSTSSMLPPLPSSLVVTSLCSCSQLSQSAGDLNSGPHACIAGTGPTEPTPQLCTANFRSLWSLQCRSCS